MFKSLALILVLTSVALAQSTATNATGHSGLANGHSGNGTSYSANSTSYSANATSSSATATSTANSLIPTAISTSCTTFLNALNTNSSLSGCLSTLMNVTSAFAPEGPTPSSSDVTSALSNLCNNTITSTCPENLIRQLIADFYVACPAELTSNSNPDVILIYDVLYALLPFRTSICSQDDSGNYCVQGPIATTRELDEDTDGSFQMPDLMAFLYIKKTGNAALRRRDETTTFLPNLTTFENTNLLFDYFTPDLNASQLCVTCARLVLTAYIQTESDCPYAPGLNNSQLLGNQSALFSAVQAKCPADFLSGAVAAAGGLSGGSLDSSAIPTYGAEYRRIIALVMGAATLISVAL